MPRKISNKEMLKIEADAKKAKNLPTVTGKWIYLCGVDPLDIDPSNHGPITVFSSVAALKKGKSCYKECGIIKVKLTYYQVRKGKF